ncbi:hypothetical protein BB560_004412 [Smittium megazygosporum]|uniref:valine--tRNA ligase n=1 Tax=Smittium megazygosporum TaxID=133381 RepID=A0A2T9Z9B1_9FUNG|nr:hypothetical protein BB560_004412 [Smittium megazygosporum]
MFKSFLSPQPASRINSRLLLKKRLLIPSILALCVKNNYSATSRKTYKPSEIEQKWSDFWVSNKLYSKWYTDPQGSVPDPKDEFNMLAPPPNVTGTLHLGHAMTTYIQDLYARWYRMNGYKVNWVPGTDHAGISTQVIVEKYLKKEKKVNRYQLGRENFISEVLNWKNSRQSIIRNQQKKLGASMNWDMEYFTMDENHSEIVQSAFIRLFNDGLIYRDTKIVNWCCALKSVISDIEVNRVTIDTPTFLKVPDSSSKQLLGALYEISYKVVDCQQNYLGNISVETTRPETILGDVAIAVHPLDDRYKVVKMDFGTGAVKVTPSHDLDDYECGKRHNLPQRRVIGFDGSTFEKNKAFSTSISQCSRTGDVIEPMIIPQWYIKMEKMAELAVKYVDNGDITLIPKKFESIWNQWLHNTEDWCISRQLWWGHQIPAYEISFNESGDQIENKDTPPFSPFWLVATSPQEAKEKALEKLNQGAPIYQDKHISSKRDEDVLDTWFSSGLLPLSAFNRNPNSSSSFDESQKKALSTLLETGNDIIFFWVARMVMLCSYFSKNPPFETVLFHSMNKTNNSFIST